LYSAVVQGQCQQRRRGQGQGRARKNTPVCRSPRSGRRKRCVGARCALRLLDRVDDAREHGVAAGCGDLELQRTRSG
jgi:hypothetical protein